MRLKSDPEITLEGAEEERQLPKWLVRFGHLMKVKLKPWQALLLFGGVIVLGLWLPSHLNVTVTPSLGKRVFFLMGKPRQGEIGRGDYVVFSEVHPWSGVASTRMTKHIACQPGDHLTVTQSRDYYCNDVYLGRSLTEDSAGTALPHFTFDGPIPTDHYFLSGGHPRSYDSRYYGLVTYDRFEQKAVPIF